MIKGPKALGDSLILTFAIDEIKRYFPNTKVIIATNRPYLYENNHNIYKIIKRHAPKFYYFARLPMDALGIKPPYSPRRLHLAVDDKTLTKMAQQLPKKFVVLNPSGNPAMSFDRRSWGFERYQQLVDLMCDTTFVQIGFATDQLLRGVLDFRGLPHMMEFAAIVKLAQAGLFHDCGFTHLAVAVQTRCVVLWGGASHISSYGHDTNINLIETVECSPCSPVGRYCEHNMRCMELLTPEFVTDKLRELLVDSAQKKSF
ncbi:hypothetical protein AGMMS50229_08470 [Campylobacterota bacterium]|nr:hypothetical protein AGMMS50229_08340 [Campylobacterota bacterium]GHV05414.1 hypothetical protein AGMMS50229_08470 [Campylobacterota bacterium]